MLYTRELIRSTAGFRSFSNICDFIWEQMLHAVIHTWKLKCRFQRSKELITVTRAWEEKKKWVERCGECG